MNKYSELILVTSSIIGILITIIAISTFLIKFIKEKKMGKNNNDKAKYSVELIIGKEYKQIKISNDMFIGNIEIPIENIPDILKQIEELQIISKKLLD